MSISYHHHYDAPPYEENHSGGPCGSSKSTPHMASVINSAAGTEKIKIIFSNRSIISVYPYALCILHAGEPYGPP